MGLPAGLSSCPKGQDNSEVAAEEPSGPYQRRESTLGQCRPQPPPPGQKNCGLFGRHGVPEASQERGQPDEILCESSDSRVAGASQGLRRGRVRPF